MMSVMRTERIWVKQSFTLMQLAHQAKNLYNYANYIIKYQLEKSKYFTQSFELMDILRYHPTYTCLLAHTAQQTIKNLVQCWKNYFLALKEWRNNPRKFHGCPQSPKYKRKKGFHILYFTNNQVRLKNGFLKFPKRVGLNIQTRLTSQKIKYARLVPKGTAFLLEVVYEKKYEIYFKAVKNILAIDLGVNNLLTCVSNVSLPFLINGKPLKSYNQWFNKRKSSLQSIYKRQNLKYSGVKLRSLQDERDRKVTDYLHKASSLVIQRCLSLNIDTIVIGFNKNWKQRSNLGNVNNQNFVNIPFSSLVNQLKYKAEEKGIRVVLTNEAYTSKCSFLDNEIIQKHKHYLGKRLKRGIFKSKNSVFLNADCNAAGNIGRKVFPLLFNSGIVDVVSRPYCLTVLSNQSRDENSRIRFTCKSYS
jgi:putative transposase